MILGVESPRKMQLFRRFVASSLLVTFSSTFALGLGGCGGSTGQNAASQVLKTPELPTDKQAKCHIAKSQAEPLIVEWPDAARGKLESVSHRGLVAVRYEGCELSVLARCTVKNNAGYVYSPITRKQSKVTIKDADELYASMPVGAVKLESKLQSAGQLNVQMTIVGRYESPTAVVYREELEGDCADATHVIAALTVGSFTFSAGSDAEVGGGVNVAGVAGGGAKSTAARETIQRDGDEAACAKSGATDKSPPEGCGALLQIEVMPLTRGSKPVAVVPPIVLPTPAPAVPIPSTTSQPLSDNTPPPPVKPIKCKKNEHAEDGICVKGPAPKKTAAITTKPTVASVQPTTCSPGQHLYNTRCVDDEPPPPPPPVDPTPVTPPPPPSCVAGTHPENGACVVNSGNGYPAPGQAYGAGETPAPGEQPNPWRLILGYTAIGAGITFTASGLVALSAAGEAKKECDTAAKTCPSDYDDKKKTAQASALIADIALGITALSLIGYFLLPAKIHVGVAATPNSVAAGASGRF